MRIGYLLVVYTRRDSAGRCRRVQARRCNWETCMEIEREKKSGLYVNVYLITSSYVGCVLMRWGFYALGSRLKRGMYGIPEESESESSFSGLRLRFF
jgi:hypothetical protein